MTTIVSHGLLQLELSELCNLIKARRSLSLAEIVSVECYAQRVGLILHRFLVLHLRREGRKDMYLRMDRRAAKDVSLTELVWASGQTQARDEVRLLLSHSVRTRAQSKCLLGKSITKQKQASWDKRGESRKSP